MENPGHHSNKDLWFQLLRYTLTTALVIGVDMGSYWLLCQSFNPMLAKTSSYCLAALVGFLLNKFWTFRAQPQKPGSASSQTQPKGQVSRFLWLNGVSLAGNILSNQTVLSVCTPGLGYNTAKGLGLLAAVCFSTVFNYIGQKYWVFR